MNPGTNKIRGTTPLAVAPLNRTEYGCRFSRLTRAIRVGLLLFNRQAPEGFSTDPDRQPPINGRLSSGSGLTTVSIYAFYYE